MANHTCYVLCLEIQATFVVLLALLFQATSVLREAEALHRWKESLLAQPILDSWVSQALNSPNATQSPCSWRGIPCDSQGSVTAINLAYTGLKGNPSKLGLLCFPKPPTSWSQNKQSHWHYTPKRWGALKTPIPWPLHQSSQWHFTPFYCKFDSGPWAMHQEMIYQEYKTLA